MVLEGLLTPQTTLTRFENPRFMCEVTRELLLAGMSEAFTALYLRLLGRRDVFEFSEFLSAVVF